MTTHSSTTSSPQGTPSSNRLILALAIAAALLTGLSEGLAWLLLGTFGGLTFDMRLAGSPARLVWFAPLFYLLPYLLLGLVFVSLRRVLPDWIVTRLAAFCFAFLVFLDLLSVTGRLQSLAIVALTTGISVVFVRWLHKDGGQRYPVVRGALVVLVLLTAAAVAGIEGWAYRRENMATAGLPAARPNAPNVLFLVLDTLRADHLSSYGYPRSTSPHIDQLAREGVLFESAVSPSSWTLPTHASFLTGLFPSEHHTDHNHPVLDGRFFTLPQGLARLGYRTGGFSGNTLLFTRSHGFDRGFHHFEDYFSSFSDAAFRTYYGRMFYRHILRRLGWEDFPGRKDADLMTDAALRWIARDLDRPFFVMINYFDLHDPYLPPQPYRSRFSTMEQPGGIINSSVGRGYPEITPEQLQGEIDAYDGALAFEDEAVQRLLFTLGQQPSSRETLVIVTSDHGESFGEHNLLGHSGSLYRDQILVPLILHGPGIPAGKRFAEPVSTVALARTVLDLVGGREASSFRGPSLAAFWTDGEAGQEPLSAYSTLSKMNAGPRGDHVPGSHGSIESVVHGGWHFIVHQKFGRELFHWPQDTQEENNLAGTAEGQRVCEELERYRKVPEPAPQLSSRRLEKPPGRGDDSANR